MTDENWYKRWQQPRAASKYFDWVRQEVEVFRYAHPSHNDDLRFSRNLGKRLQDEIYSIGQFAKHYFENMSHVDIEWVNGNQKFDAKVHCRKRFLHTQTPEFIEVTQTLLDADNEYKNHLLKRDGHFIVNSRISRESKKRFRKSKNVNDLEIDSSRVTRSPTSYFNSELERIIKVAEKKSKIDYNEKTALVIIFNDSFRVIPDEDRLKGFAQTFLARAPAELTNFFLVALLGPEGKHYLQFKPEDFLIAPKT